MGCFHMDTDHHRGIVGNGVIVEWVTLGVHERHTAMFGGVLCIIHEESSEGMDPPKEVKWYDHENRQENLPDGQEVIIGRFTLDGREDIERLFEQKRDGIRAHGSLDGMLLGRTRVVENGNDNDGRKSVGSGELGQIHG
jgi:hypothetical protein